MVLLLLPLLSLIPAVVFKTLLQEVHLLQVHFFNVEDVRFSFLLYSTNNLPVASCISV